MKSHSGNTVILNRLAISEGAYNRNRKSTSKQATAVLIKICLGFTGFQLFLSCKLKFNFNLANPLEAKLSSLQKD